MSTFCVVMKGMEWFGWVQDDGWMSTFCVVMKGIEWLGWVQDEG